MEKGSLIERRLDNSVLNRIMRIDKDLMMGAGIGNDYSRSGNTVVADGSGESPEIAWIKALNNFSCSGAIPLGARITILLPTGIKESLIRNVMDEFRKCSEASNIQIAGGQTQVTEAVQKPYFTVQLYGTASAWLPDRKKIICGMSVVMCGYAGMLGTGLLAERFRGRMAEYFGNSFLKRDKLFEPAGCGISDAARCILETAEKMDVIIPYLHDISCGGVYAALWQLGRWADCGFIVDNKKIPVRQETIEVCECLDINPYLCDGTGGLLAICDNGEVLINCLADRGIKAELIGRITEDPERKVRFGDNEFRTLAPPIGDSIYVEVLNPFQN